MTTPWSSTLVSYASLCSRSQKKIEMQGFGEGFIPDLPQATDIDLSFEANRPTNLRQSVASSSLAYVHMGFTGERLGSSASHRPIPENHACGEHWNALSCLHLDSGVDSLEGALSSSHTFDCGLFDSLASLCSSRCIFRPG